MFLIHDRLTEERAADQVAGCRVGRFPGLLEAELLHPRLIGIDGGAFGADAVFLDRLGGFRNDPVFGRVAIQEVIVEVFRSISR